MKKLLAATAAAALASLVGGLALAESSGNFSARIATAQCTVNNTTGNLTGGLNGTLLNTTVQTPNASSTALLIRPSLVTGLFTRTKVDSSDPSIAVAGVKVRVLIDGRVVAPGEPAGDPAGANDGWIYYDKRFQRLESNLFNLFTGVDCDTASDGYQPCFLELILSTLSAHSFDFVVGDVGGGQHNVKVEWKLEPSAATANEAACVGPGVLTVEQVKTFATGGGIVITTQP